MSGYSGGWMGDEWMGGWISGQMGGWVGEQVGGEKMDTKVDRWMEG